VAANVSDPQFGSENCDIGFVGTFLSVGYNLTNDATGTACGFTQGTDKVNVNPDLSPLADNGGPTQTMLPLPGSPAIGVIPSPTTLNGVAVCGAGAFDQRGVPRPTPGPNCAIGAVEPGLDAAALLASLQHRVIGVGPGTSLYDKLGQAETYLAANDKADTCGVVGAFNHEVTAQSGKSITNSKATSLIASATRIEAVLGC
jgi:hypothetical protein